MYDINRADQTDILSGFSLGNCFSSDAFYNYSRLVDDFTYVAPSGIVTKENKKVERGLFTAKDISKGDFIGTYFGDVVWSHSPLDFTSVPAFLKSFFKADDSEFISPDVTYVIWGQGENRWMGVDGKNKLRYANHQGFLSANMLLKGFNFYAVRDIERGEELSWPYSLKRNNSLRKDTDSYNNELQLNPMNPHLLAANQVAQPS